MPEMTDGIEAIPSIDALSDLSAVSAETLADSEETRRQQMVKVEIFARVKSGIEKAIEQHRDRTREDLTTSQFAAQILLAIYKEDIAFYFDSEASTRATQAEGLLP